jgi:ribosomal 50S subunit-associated protein YjgA (DUF615 family)
MIRRLLLLAAVLCTGASAAEKVEVTRRTLSSSRQFTVFCANDVLRSRVASAAEWVKADVLALLNETDRWKIPVLINLERASSEAAAQQPVQLRFLETPEGPKITMHVQIGNDPAAVNLQKHIVRAILLEYAYRDRGGVKGGEEYFDPPWWLVDGALQIFRQRDQGVDADFFRQLIESNKLPPIHDFLSLRSDNVGAAAQAVDSAWAMCFLQLLLEQPGGKDSLARFVATWPECNGDALAALARQYPPLSDAGNMQKWWTVNVAKLSTVDRYKGLSAEDTDRELSQLLNFEVVTNKAGEKKAFTLTECDQFVKLPGSKAAMGALRSALAALSTQGNALLRPALNDYAQLALDVQRGKTKQVRERVVRIEQYRAAVLQRNGEIADYLNWYEATQIGARSNAFDSYLKAANEISEQEARRKTPIAEYLDQLQQEF